MKRSITAALLLATLVCPAFAAVDTFIWFDAPGGKQLKVQLIGLANASVTQAEFATGRLDAGHRKWAPFHISRKSDSSSPALWQALSKGTNSFDIEQDQVGPNGKLTPLFKIHVTGVKGSKTKNPPGRGNTFEIEDFSFTFTKITWTWVKGGVTAQDDWEART